MPRRAQERPLDAIPKLEEAKLPALPEWMIEAILLHREPDARLRILGLKLEAGEEIHRRHLDMFIPPLTDSFAKIDRGLQPDTVWFVAAMRFYREPFDALFKILEHVKAGDLCTIPDGREFYQHHKRWVTERGDLGLVNTSSISLFFREQPNLRHSRLDE